MKYRKPEPNENFNAFLNLIYKDPTVIPSRENVLKCFNYFSPPETKIIIIGQDPYPNKNDAMGLAFSVPHDKPPASLRNIFLELHNDLHLPMPSTGNLEPWAQQGVLLINTVLTTREGASNSHKALGWQTFVKNQIEKVLLLKKPIVIIAWGKSAKDFVSEIKLHDNVFVLTGGHPSPINSRGGFFGGKYFSKANEFLSKNNLNPINWELP